MTDKRPDTCEHEKASITIDTDDGEDIVCAICNDVRLSTLDDE